MCRCQNISTTFPLAPAASPRFPCHRFDAAAFAEGGRACSPRILGIGADSGHHEHRSPSTSVATDARGWRSTLRRSTARLVPQPGQNTSSHGVPAISAARIVGDHSMSRLAASCSFQRSMTAFARGGIGNLPLGVDGNVEAPRPHAHGAVLPESGGATIALRAAEPSPGCPGLTVAGALHAAQIGAPSDHVPPKSRKTAISEEHSQLGRKYRENHRPHHCVADACDGHRDGDDCLCTEGTGSAGLWRSELLTSRRAHVVRRCCVRARHVRRCRPG